MINPIKVITKIAICKTFRNWDRIRPYKEDTGHGKVYTYMHNDWL